jgi:hypothetical protein
MYAVRSSGNVTITPVQNTFRISAKVHTFLVSIITHKRRFG